MKRAKTMLGALALMAAGFLFAAPAAHATISCTPVTSYGTTDWPYDGSVLKCGTVSNSYALGVASELNDLSSHAPDLYDAMSIVAAPYYVFRDQDEYDEYMDLNLIDHLEPGAGLSEYAFGVTYQDTNFIPQYTAIFTYNGESVSIDSVSNINFVTAHETGHWADYIYSGLTSGGFGPFMSLGDHYNDLSDQDWDNLNLLPNCNGGANSLFIGRKDYWDNPICVSSALNNPPFSGSNQSILQNHSETYLNEYGWLNHFEANQERFAMQVAIFLGTSDDAPNGVTPFLKTDKRFGCSRELIESLLTIGELPLQSDLTAVTMPHPETGSASCPTTGFPSSY